MAYLVAGAGVVAAVWPFVGAFLFFLTCFLVVVAFVPEVVAGVLDACAASVMPALARASEAPSKTAEIFFIVRPCPFLRGRLSIPASVIMDAVSINPG